MFTVSGRVMKVFTQVGNINKETGEKHPDSLKLQIMGEIPIQGDDSRLDLITLGIEDAKAYVPLYGKTIRVPLGFFAPQKGNIVYFIPKGSIPEIVDLKTVA